MQPPSFRISEIASAARRRSRARRRLRVEGDLPTIYAVGDVHGCFDAMLAAEERIRWDIRLAGEPALIVYLGDYVDRGPASAAVLEHLATDRADGLQRITLCGNHDDAFLKFLRDPATNIYWLGPNFGGAATLSSYGIDVEEAMWGQRASLGRMIPTTHADLLADLPILLEAGRYLYVHAGIMPEVPLQEQRDEDLLWIREPFLTEGPGLPLTVVHGHTPVDEPEFGPARIGIDTACFSTGRLTVLKVDKGGARRL